jgi:hypothetical protein
MHPDTSSVSNSPARSAALPPAAPVGEANRPEPDERWVGLLAKRKESPEVGVRRNDDAVLCRAAIENIVICRRT